MELKLEAVLNSLTVCVFIVDATGAFVLVNDAALATIGASSLEELQSSERPFQFPNVRTEDGALIPHESLPFQRALSGESVVHVLEVLDRGTGGTLVLRSRASPLRNDEGTITGAVKVAIDVTQEYELAKIRDEFIRQAAHELKTPLAAIKANAELLAAGEGRASAQLGALIRGVDRIDGLVSSLLDLADLEGGMFSFSRLPVPLQRVIEGALARLPAGAVRRVKVHATPVVVECDEARMRRALYALIDNAVKYSPPPSTIEISVIRDEKVARVAVRDHGYGIPEDKQPRMFEKYFRAHAGTDRDPGGIGVGLFVAREIIRQHGGRIWFESTENSGTVFYVELPVAEETT